MSDLDLRMVREDDALLDALGRGCPAPQRDQVAQLLAGWRTALAADTGALRPVPARARGDRRPSVWLATAAAALLLLAGWAVRTGAVAARCGKRGRPDGHHHAHCPGAVKPGPASRGSGAQRHLAGHRAVSALAVATAVADGRHGARSVPLPIPVPGVPDLPLPPPQLPGPPPRALPPAPR